MNVPKGRSSHDAFYLERLKKHGIFSTQSVSCSEVFQDNCFDILSGIFEQRGSGSSYTVLDFGAGLGDFSAYLKRNGYAGARYTGIDIIPEMVISAKRKYPKERFFAIDFMESDFQECFDYIICSGGMNILHRENPREHFEYIKASIAKMYRLCRKGISFNLLSKRGVDFFTVDNRFYYSDPDAVEAFCRELCNDVELDHEYYEYIFTVFMRK